MSSGQADATFMKCSLLKKLYCEGVLPTGTLSPRSPPEATNSHRACALRLVLAQGTAPPQIVMGISAKPHKVINLSKARRRRLPAIRRFTGGGTVVVDHNTLFASLIMNAVRASSPPHPASGADRALFHDCCCTG